MTVATIIMCSVREQVLDEESLAKPASRDVRSVILETLRSKGDCELESLTQRCSQFTWNEVFSEIDRLSRSGDIQMISQGRGRYLLRVQIFSTAAKYEDQVLPQRRAR